MRVVGYVVQYDTSSGVYSYRGMSHFCCVCTSMQKSLHCYWVYYMKVFHLRHYWSLFATCSRPFLLEMALFFVYHDTTSACMQHIDAESLCLKFPWKMLLPLKNKQILYLFFKLNKINNKNGGIAFYTDFCNFCIFFVWRTFKYINDKNKSEENRDIV